jgi:hypothetical protein
LLLKTNDKATAEVVDALTQPFYFYGNSLRIATAQILPPLPFEIMMLPNNGVQRCLRTQQAWNACRAMMRNTGHYGLVALPPI